MSGKSSTWHYRREYSIRRRCPTLRGMRKERGPSAYSAYSGECLSDSRRPSEEIGRAAGPAYHDSIDAITSVFLSSSRSCSNHNHYFLDCCCVKASQKLDTTVAWINYPHHLLKSCTSAIADSSTARGNSASFSPHPSAATGSATGSPPSHPSGFSSVAIVKIPPACRGRTLRGMMAFTGHEPRNSGGENGNPARLLRSQGDRTFECRGFVLPD